MKLNKKNINFLKANFTGIFFRLCVMIIPMLITTHLLDWDVFLKTNTMQGLLTNIMLSINVWGAIITSWLLCIGSLLMFNYMIPLRKVKENEERYDDSRN